MTDAFLLSRVRLEFDSQQDDLLNELSAIALTPEGHLWVGSDEFLTVERLTPLETGLYGTHHAFHLGEFLSLVDDSEIDIEGLDYSADYLWLVGSHSAKRKKPKGKNSGVDAQKDIERLATITKDDNRYLLARIPVIGGQPVQSGLSATTGENLTAACLGGTPDNVHLLKLLKHDDHLKPFLKGGIPSKDNGLDIEGLAVHQNRAFLGLRGPVLRGWAVMVELDLKMNEPGCLKARKLVDDRRYRKHFFDLDGLGIRDLCFHNNDLIILAGPTMALAGAMRIFRWRDALSHEGETLWPQTAKALEPLCDLPYNPNFDKAEGAVLFPYLGYDNSLMVVYDAPDPSRRDERSIFADVFRLPK